MATKLKNMRLTSVDLVRNGANQEADICLFKSADPEEAPTQPTAEEKNIFKRFINWLRENHAEAGGEPADPESVEKDYTTFNSLTATRENNEKLWQYTNALTESIQSIMRDQDLDKDQKYKLMAQSLDQFDEAMDELIEALCEAAPPSALTKSDEEDVEKFNPYHGSDGRFTSGGGGAAAGGGGKSQKDSKEDLERACYEAEGKADDYGAIYEEMQEKYDNGEISKDELERSYDDYMAAYEEYEAAKERLYEFDIDEIEEV